MRNAGLKLWIEVFLVRSRSIATDLPRISLLLTQ